MRCLDNVPLILGALLATLTPLSAPAETLTVPIGSAVEIDGVVAEAEWADASRIELADGAAVLLKHDGESLLLAYEGFPRGDVGFGCVFVSHGDAVHVLHASAQLGSAVYRRGEHGTWSPDAVEYVWKDGERMWREEGWRANVEPENGAQEFRIAMDRLGADAESREIRLALGYIIFGSGDPRVEVWPPSVDDDCRNARLLSGFNPNGLRFSSASWQVLRFAPADD